MKKIRYLVSLLIFSATMAVVLPLFDMIYLYPSMTRLLLDEAALQTKQVAGLVALEHGRLDQQQLRALRIAASLSQLTVLRNDGAVLLSADPDAVGGKRKIEGYLSLLRSGQVASRLEMRVEDGTARTLIVSYAPLISGEKLTSVVEVVQDISRLRIALDRLTTRASMILLLVAALFLGVVVFVALRAKEALLKQEQSDLKLRESQQEIAHKHDELELLFKQVARAKHEWQLTLDCLDEMVLLVDKKGMIRRCNRSFARFVDHEFIGILGKHWQKILFAQGIDVLSMAQEKFEIYHKERAQHYTLNFYRSEEGEETLTVIRVKQTEPGESRNGAEK